MADYPRLRNLLADASADPAGVLAVVPYLTDVWLEDYESTVDKSDVVETRVQGFSYLFDILHERLLAAWGVSQGRHAGARDKARMAGHPLSAGRLHHRGHAIPHTLGGPTDINLVPQLASVNVGDFRVLERRAVATPGALYFTYWTYPRRGGQTPVAIDQGLLVPGKPPELRFHRNSTSGPRATG